MGKLWDKGVKVHELLERFTTGNDYILDNRLVSSDCTAGIAHARMLNSIGILSDDEFGALKNGLVTIIREQAGGTFIVRREDEDCHTAIENRLSADLGEPGKKIHTGRSRNDQVLGALRLYGRQALLDIMENLESLVDALIDFSDTYAAVPMPGRTHMQIAMPSTVGLWAAAWAEDLSDDYALLWGVYDLYNQCPLGAAAGYGVPLPLDRTLTAGLLGFRRVQNNVIYVNNSRGKFEAAVLDVLDGICLTLSRMAQDLILFSLPELGYFALPEELCTGSSIMPQKKNPDGLELLRAKSAVMTSYASRIRGILRALPSGYNRDVQDTKEPFLEGLSTAYVCLGVMKITIEHLEVREEALRKAFTPEIYATDAALDLVAGGLSFRDAYRQVGTNLDSLTVMDPDEVIGKRTAQGTPGNPSPDRCRQTLREHARRRKEEIGRIEKILEDLVGFVPPLVTL